MIAPLTRIVAAASAAALVVTLSFGDAAAASGDRQNEMKAREAFAAGRYDEALQLFAKLYAESLHPVYLRNIGRCHQKMREPDKAIDAFRDYLAKAKKVTPDEQKEIEGYIREMEAMKEAQAQARPTSPPPATSPPPPATPPPAPAPAPTEASLVTTAQPP